MTSRQSDQVVICCEDSRHGEQCAELAHRFGIPLVRVGDDREANARFTLAFDTSDRLTLHDRDDPRATGTSVRFDTLPVRHGRIVVSKKDPLGRAFGDRVRTIVDATAGLGNDAFLLACMGFLVTAVERSPVVAALLADGLHRAFADGRLRNAVDDRITLTHADAISYLRASAHGDAAARPDAVYIDPMFPPKRKKSALAKKAIRDVRAIVGDDPDADELFDAAVQAATIRIVVKRPDDALPLAPRPVASIHGKLVRYDVYHPHASGAATLNLPS